MNKRWRTLIVDTDPDTLLMLQQVLEEADIDALMPLLRGTKWKPAS